MALMADSTHLGLRITQALNRASQWINGFMGQQQFSPEETLWEQPLLDARFAPRTAMTNENIDVHTLNVLGSLGLKRGKLMTKESHPELMAACDEMAKRAGLAKTPQLILVESDSLNALTLSKQEMAITTGLLRAMDYRSVCTVLGHEFGHASSDHTTIRILSTGALGLAGMLVGGEVARAGGFGRKVSDFISNRFASVNNLLTKIYGADRSRSSSLPVAAAYIGMGFTVGSIIANHISVRPTELDADAKGARISGDPEGLALALETLAKHMPERGILHKLNALRSGYPSIETRVRKLRELAVQQPAQFKPIALMPSPVPEPGKTTHHIQADAVSAAPVVQIQGSTISAERSGTPVTAPALS